MGDFKNTNLYQTTLASQRRDQFEVPRERLRNALENFRQRASLLAGEIHVDVRNLTVHDITHIDALWETADIIAGERIGLTPTEAFVLGGAFLVHDLGMGLAAYPGGLAELQSRREWNDLIVASLRTELGRDPDSNEIANPPPEVIDQVKFWMLRALHAEQAEHLAHISWNDPTTRQQFHLIEDPELRSSFAPLIGRIAHSHWWATDDLPQHFPPKRTGTPVSFPNEWAIDTLKLALLLRLADAAHLDGRRAPAFLRALRRPKGVSELHWLFQSKLYQIQREADKLVYTSQPFARSESQAWWLCYDTLKMVDAELRRADDLNSELHRDRFAARGVRGIEDPRRLVELLTTSGWLPVDAQVRVGHVADLVRKLGGQELYGDDRSVPLRELVQNAADAIRARRALEGLNDEWGDVRLRAGGDEYGLWLEIEDNGVGMSAAVLTGAFLDFGASFWSTHEAVIQFPGLLSSGFRSTGHYGIGFFSVFMWTDRVRVTTRQYDEAVRETRVLEFERGLDSRPLLRPAEPAEWIKDGGTRIRVWPRDVDDINSDWIQLQSDFSTLEKFSGPYSVAKRICLAMDVNVIVDNTSEEEYIVRAFDWLKMSGKELLERTAMRRYGAAIEDNLAGSNVRPLFHQGKVVGRATICPGQNGAVVVGGFRSRTQVSIAGVLVGESIRASRDEARVIVSDDELARWATEQAGLILSLDLPPQVKAKCGRLIAALGGCADNFPVARVGGVWLQFQELVEWSRNQESVIIMDESDAEKALGRLGATRLRSNVLIEPEAGDGLLVKDAFRIFRSGYDSRLAEKSKSRRPAVQAIATAWRPTTIVVWSGESFVDDYEEVLMDVEEVRREETEDGKEQKVVLGYRFHFDGKSPMRGNADELGPVDPRLK
jgi:hypothetical protein